jgi:hypothetical protein
LITANHAASSRTICSASGSQIHSCSLAFRARILDVRSKSKANSYQFPHNSRNKRIAKQKTMKRKHLILATAALLAAGGLWLARSGWRSDHSALPKTAADAGFNEPSNGPESGQTLNPQNPGRTLAPPNQIRKFQEFTPEQRVEFARRGHGPGG